MSGGFSLISTRWISNFIVDITKLMYKCGNSLPVVGNRFKDNNCTFQLNNFQQNSPIVYILVAGLKLYQFRRGPDMEALL